MMTPASEERFLAAFRRAAEASAQADADRRAAEQELVAALRELIKEEAAQAMKDAAHAAEPVMVPPSPEIDERVLEI